MVAVRANFLEVIVFAAGADTFLAVCRSGMLSVSESKKDIFKLVHPGIGEKQGGIVLRDDW
jgi:hypothetical protein